MFYVYNQWYDISCSTLYFRFAAYNSWHYISFHFYLQTKVPCILKYQINLISIYNLAHTVQRTHWLHCEVQPVNDVVEINTVYGGIRTKRIIQCVWAECKGLKCCRGRSTWKLLRLLELILWLSFTCIRWSFINFGKREKKLFWITDKRK